MSQKKFKEKYNEGCIKIFKLLQLLYDDKAEYDDVIGIFSSDESDSDKQHVTLNKFLNTLKVFGMKIYKSNKRYKTLNLPFSIKFDKDDLKAINIFENISESLPDGKNKFNLQEFIKLIESRFDDKAQISFNNIKSDDNTDYSFYYSNLREQIELCEKYCQVKFKLKIKYYLNGEETVTYCDAKEVVYDNKNAYLRIFKEKVNEIEDILVTNIISFDQLPTNKDENKDSKTVVYVLKERLAKAYVLKEHEHIDEYREDGSIVIINRNEPIDALIKRLMRYDYDCEILQPRLIRAKMIDEINKTLKNYD